MSNYEHGRFIIEQGIYDKTVYLSNSYNNEIVIKLSPINKNINVYLSDVQNNYFAITHLNYTDENYVLFRPFKKIIITRSKDEILQSWERFRSIRNGKGEIDITSLNQYHWIDYPNTFHLTFNNMINKDVPIIDNLQQFLFGNILHNSRTCIRTALSASSLTKSNIR